MFALFLSRSDQPCFCFTLVQSALKSLFNFCLVRGFFCHRFVFPLPCLCLPLSPSSLPQSASSSSPHSCSLLAYQPLLIVSAFTFPVCKCLSSSHSWLLPPVVPCLTPCCWSLSVLAACAFWQFVSSCFIFHFIFQVASNSPPTNVTFTVYRDRSDIMRMSVTQKCTKNKLLCLKQRPIPNQEGTIHLILPADQKKNIPHSFDCPVDIFWAQTYFYPVICLWLTFNRDEGVERHRMMIPQSSSESVRCMTMMGSTWYSRNW